MSDWHSATIPVDAVDADICFLLDTDYEGVTLPAIPRQDVSLVRVSELAGNETHLAQYYEQVLKIALQSETPFSEIAHNFWMRMFMWNSSAGVCVSFPWYDTYSEMKPFLERTLSREPGELYWDRDQGWEINVELHEWRVFIRDWNPDDEEVHSLVSFPVEPFRARVRQLMIHTEAAIQELTRLLGDDVWTRQVNQPRFRLWGHKS